MDPQTSQASEIYAADGTLIGKFFNENRSPVKYEEINPYFFKALIDTEDERYYKRPRGMVVDPIGIFSAMKDAVLRHDGRGASTISQQLAKNMFRVRSQYSTGLLGKIPGLKILIVKSKEWIIATKPGDGLQQERDHHHVRQYRRLRLQRLRHQDGSQDLFRHHAERA